MGYSYMSADLVPHNRSNLNGWDGSVEGKVLPLVAIVADFRGHCGSAPLAVNPRCTAIVGGGGLLQPYRSAGTDIHSFLFGPQVSVSAGRVRRFAHTPLIGAAHMSAASLSCPVRTRRWLTLWAAELILT